MCLEIVNSRLKSWRFQVSHHLLYTIPSHIKNSDIQNWRFFLKIISLLHLVWTLCSTPRGHKSEKHWLIILNDSKTATLIFSWDTRLMAWHTYWHFSKETPIRQSLFKQTDTIPCYERKFDHAFVLCVFHICMTEKYYVTINVLHDDSSRFMLIMWSCISVWNQGTDIALAGIYIFPLQK